MLLEKLIDIMQKDIYQDKEIDTNISNNVIEESLLICTRNVHLTFNGKIYVQIDRVAILSSLFNLLVDIFIVQLEQRVLLKIFIWIFEEDTFMIPYFC